MELDCRSVCRKTGVSPEADMDVVTRVELEYSYGAGDGWTRSGVASMPKERSGGPRLDQSCDWEKYGYDNNYGPLSLRQASQKAFHVLLATLLTLCTSALSTLCLALLRLMTYLWQHHSPSTVLRLLGGAGSCNIKLCGRSHLRLF